LTAPPYRVLRHRDFRLLWLSQLVSQTGSQMQTVALHWHVYLLTRSPLALGALGLTRVVPITLSRCGEEWPPTAWTAGG